MLGKMLEGTHGTRDSRKGGLPRLAALTDIFQTPENSVWFGRAPAQHLGVLQVTALRQDWHHARCPPAPALTHARPP